MLHIGDENVARVDWKHLHLLSESLMPLGTMEPQLRIPLNSLGYHISVMFLGLQVALNWDPIMPGNANLPDACRRSLVGLVTMANWCPCFNDCRPLIKTKRRNWPSQHTHINATNLVYVFALRFIQNREWKSWKTPKNMVCVPLIDGGVTSHA